MDLLQLFYEDHDDALQRLSELREDIKNGNRDGVLDFLKFLSHALDEHFRQEEEALFPPMIEVMGEGGPVKVMIQEHEDLRKNHKEVSAALAEGKAVSEVLDVLHSIDQVLSAHIQKENQILFPMAKQMFSSEQLQAISKKGMDMRE